MKTIMDIPAPNAEYMVRNFNTLSKEGKLSFVSYMKFLLYQELMEIINYKFIVEETNDD